MNIVTQIATVWALSIALIILVSLRYAVAEDRKGSPFERFLQDADARDGGVDREREPLP